MPILRRLLTVKGFSFSAMSGSKATVQEIIEGIEGPFFERLKTTWAE